MRARKKESFLEFLFWNKIKSTFEKKVVLRKKEELIKYSQKKNKKLAILQKRERERDGTRLKKAKTLSETAKIGWKLLQVNKA